MQGGEEEKRQLRREACDASSGGYGEYVNQWKAVAGTRIIMRRMA
jgi:hypothetical protein